MAEEQAKVPNAPTESATGRGAAITPDTQGLVLQMTCTEGTPMSQRMDTECRSLAGRTPDQDEHMTGDEKEQDQGPSFDSNVSPRTQGHMAGYWTSEEDSSLLRKGDTLDGTDTVCSLSEAMEIEKERLQQQAEMQDGQFDPSDLPKLLRPILERTYSPRRKQPKRQ